MKKWHDCDEVFDAQQMFRLMLEALANPTRRVDIQPCAKRFPAANAPLLAVGLTLLDNEVGFCVYGDDLLAQTLVSLTLARLEPPERADFIFVPDARDAGAVIPLAKSGTPEDPHLGATVVLLDSGAETCPLRLSGAGIDGIATFAAGTAAADALRVRDQQNHEYPQGIDLIFVTEAGALYALPRTTRREVC